MALGKTSGIDPKLIQKAYTGMKKRKAKLKKKGIPKGYHKMPDGTIMKDSEHKK
jgi:hypothetical protein